MLPLLILSLLSAPQYRGSNRIPRDGRCSSRTGTCSTTNPGFQFLFSGGTECAGTVPTGSKGETISFSRAGGQTCTRANGNVVKLTANQPVVESLTGMALSDGNLATTGSQLGMLDEASVANATLQSEALDNAAWSSNNSASSNPVVTANAGAAPDGTITAERLQFPATSGTQFSERFQTSGCPATGTVSASIYAMGNGAAATIDIVTGSTTAVSCAVPNGTWVRCVAPIFTTTTFFEVGHFSNLTTQSRSADDVFLWGAQCEISPWATSYIPTTTVAVTRSATSWTVDTTALTPPVTSASGCFGADAYFSKWENLGGIGGTAYGCGLSGGSSGSRVPYEARIGTADYEFRNFDGANQNTNTALNTTYVGTTVSLYAWWKTGGPINSYGLGRGTDQGTYTNNLIGVGGAGGSYVLGHTGAGCGLNTAAWLTRIRMDVDFTGGQCQ
jgi:hypothetical protein